MSVEAESRGAESTSESEVNYEALSSLMKEKLGLRYSPVGVSLTADSRELVPRIAKTTAFCGMLAKAARGESFHAEIKDHGCIGAKYYLGLEDLPDYPAMKRGLYFERQTPEAAIRSRSSSPRIPLGAALLITCYPLATAPVKPDVVVVFADPLQGMHLVRASLYDTGELVSGLSGSGSCSMVVSLPFISGKAIYTLSDSGARAHMKLERDLLLVGLPAQKLATVFDALKTMKKGVHE